jgi:cytoskeletal protein RodZ
MKKGPGRGVRMERVGKILKEAREKKDISWREASQATKIGINFLKALENDEYEVFPNIIYLKSFIKNYAYFLGLDGEKIAREFKPAEFPSDEKLPLIKYNVGHQARKLLVIVVTMILVWLLWVLYQTVVVKF